MEKDEHTLEMKQPITLAEALSAGKKVGPDAIEILVQDHREVLGAFTDYDLSNSIAQKALIAAKICTDLTAHALAEEEVFYPTVREAMRDDGLVDESYEDHREAKDLISQIESGLAAEEDIDALMTQLRTAVQAHVKTEEEQLFPKTRKATLNLYELGRRLIVRKVEALFKITKKPPPLGDDTRLDGTPRPTG